MPQKYVKVLHILNKQDMRLKCLTTYQYSSVWAKNTGTFYSHSFTALHIFVSMLQTIWCTMHMLYSVRCHPESSPSTYILWQIVTRRFEKEAETWKALAVLRPNGVSSRSYRTEDDKTNMQCKNLF